MRRRMSTHSLSVSSSPGKPMRRRMSIHSLGLESPRRRMRKNVARFSNTECPITASIESNSSGDDDACLLPAEQSPRRHAEKETVLDKSDNDRYVVSSIEMKSSGEDDDGLSPSRRSPRRRGRKYKILGGSEHDDRSVASFAESSKRDCDSRFVSAVECHDTTRSGSIGFDKAPVKPSSHERCQFLENLKAEINVNPLFLAGTHEKLQSQESQSEINVDPSSDDRHVVSAIDGRAGDATIGESYKRSGYLNLTMSPTKSSSQERPKL
jgi:hypothetical protein